MCLAYIVSCGHSLQVAVLLYTLQYCMEDSGFPGGLAVKNPPENAGDRGSIPGWGRLPGEGSGNSFHYSCLGNSIGRDAWWGHGVAMGQTRLSD